MTGRRVPRRSELADHGGREVVDDRAGWIPIGSKKAPRAFVRGDWRSSRALNSFAAFGYSTVINNLAATVGQGAVASEAASAAPAPSAGSGLAATNVSFESFMR